MLSNRQREQVPPLSRVMRATINLPEWSPPLKTQTPPVFVLCSYKVDTDVQTRL